MNSTELREEIARTILAVSNRWLAPNFPPSHKLRDFEDLDERERRLHLEYADALLPLLSAARDEGAQQMREACRKIAMDLAKKCDRDARGDHKAAVLWDAYHAMGQARHPTPPSL